MNNINGYLSAPSAPQSGYRVMLLRANGKVGLISLATTQVMAVRIGKEARQRHLEILQNYWQQIVSCDDRPRMIYLEVWQGSPSKGTWKPLRRKGFPFEFHDRPRGKRNTSPASTLKFCKTGDVVACVLLPEKTRKGGWRARVIGTSYEGPITNWQAITSGAGDQVQLKVCGISSTSGQAQFSVPR